jgi:membrane-associated phospholipid phosphatase
MRVLRNTSENSLAAFLEFVFQPVLVVLYGTVYFLLGEFFVFSTGPTPISTLIPDLSVVLLALLMAFCGAFIAKKVESSRKVSSDDAVASTGAVALAATTVGLSHLVVLNRLIVVGSLGVMAVILLGSFVRMFFKISGHMLMLSFVITGLVVMGNRFVLPVYLLLFPVGWCRLRLQRHSVEQVILGTVAGFAIAIIGYWALNALRLL